jgi:hypothetical protein
METQNSFLPLRDLTEMMAPLNRLKMSMTDPMVDFTQFWNEVSGTPFSKSKEHARPREETRYALYQLFRLEERRSAAFNDNSSQPTDAAENAGLWHSLPFPALRKQGAYKDREKGVSETGGD